MNRKGKNMKCRFKRKVFRNNDTGYCVFIYHTEEEGVPQGAKNKQYNDSGTDFSAIGYHLPDTDSIEIDIKGRWVTNPKYGLQLEVESYQEVVPATAKGMEGYLASGMIKGIGPRMAEKIVQKFGKRTFEVLDKEPERLLQIPGITENKLSAIIASYQSTHAVRDLAAYLAPYKITQKKIQKIYEQFGSDSLETVKNSPFSLCEISGFGFLTVDEIARATGCRLDDPLRMEGCIRYCMDLEMKNGHLYLEREELKKNVYEQLNKNCQGEVASARDITTAIYRMVTSRKLVAEDTVLYDSGCFLNEVRAADAIAEMLVQEDDAIQVDLLIEKAQKELGMQLSTKQAQGVKMAFSHKLSIITGGPGTGKTTVEKVLLYVHKQLNGGEVLLMAPTGRASRRMAESTGHMDACTMHSGLGLLGDDTEDYEAAIEPLDAEFILDDEFSMVDMRLGAEFFTRIKKGTRVVLIGDVNQLPSVGPGNVFRELILCGIVPVTVLDMVFRQGENSRIAANAEKMQENNTKLEYGDDFMLFEADGDKEAAEVVRRLYLETVAKKGVENVQILTPYRKRGEVSVNELNEYIRNKVNPLKPGEPEIRASGTVFHLGDKIIQNKNKDQISNGDTGFIENIYRNQDEEERASLSFSDERRVDYGIDEMDMVEHAYATTVHKSQGCEYPVIILPWIPMFYKMLRRNILYTAITRAKEQVLIVGSRKAIYMAIHNTDSDKRNTKLGERVVKRYYELVDKRKIEIPEVYEQAVINF